MPTISGSPEPREGGGSWRNLAFTQDALLGSPGDFVVEDGGEAATTSAGEEALLGGAAVRGASRRARFATMAALAAAIAAAGAVAFVSSRTREGAGAEVSLGPQTPLLEAYIDAAESPKWPHEVSPLVVHHSPASPVNTLADIRHLTASDKEVTFDCLKGASDWKKSWSVWKKRWCCSKQEIGCLTGVTGTFHIINLKYDELVSQPAIHRNVDEAIQTSLFLVAAGDDHHPVRPTSSHVAASSPYNTVDVALEEWSSSVGNTVVRFELDPPKHVESLVRENLRFEDIVRVLEERLHSVASIDKVSRTPILVRHGVVDAQVVRSTCRCDDGVATEGLDCPGEGGHVCASCYAGFRLVDTQCIGNECLCGFGVAAEGSECKTQGAHICDACNQGFHLQISLDGEEKTCEENVCTCDNGMAVFGAACTSHNGNMCSSCDEGFHVDPTDYLCKPNKCFCLDGDPVDAGDPLCIVHQTEVCKDCLEFWHVDKKTHKCVENRCHCSAGTAAVGDHCPLNGDHKCVDCNGDLMLQADGSCGHEECTCLNGVAAEGAACKTHGGNICSSCDSGFYMVQEQCVKDVCVCEHGIPTSGEQCKSDSDHICKECFPGFGLDDEGKCVGNNCICEHGTPAEGKLCLESGLHVCATCDDGYHPEVSNHEVSGRLQVMCLPNSCICLHGTPATETTATKCHTDLGNVCSACDDGFSLNVKHLSCQATTCSCINGIPKMGTDCMEQGEEDCKKCDDGYHLTTEHAVVPGTEWCRSNSATTPPVFDCDDGYTNRFLGWSRLKKHWCCEHERKGCGLTATARQACEGNKLNRRQCSLVGCCEYNEKVGCIASSEVDPEGQCHGGSVVRWGLTESIKEQADGASEGTDSLCLAAIEPHRENGVVNLLPCNAHDAKQSWQYNEATKQLRNVYGMCLGAKEGKGVHMTECVEDDSPAGAQAWAEQAADDADGVRLAGSEVKACLTVKLGGNDALPDHFQSMSPKVLSETINKFNDDHPRAVGSLPCDDDAMAQVWKLSMKTKATWTATSTSTTVTSTTTTTQTTSTSTVTTTMATTTMTTTTTKCETAKQGSDCWNSIKAVKENSIPAKMPPCDDLDENSTDEDIQTCLASSKVDATCLMPCH